VKGEEGLLDEYITARLRWLLWLWLLLISLMLVSLPSLPFFVSLGVPWVVFLVYLLSYLFIDAFI